MKKFYTLLTLLTTIPSFIMAQSVGIGTNSPDPSAKLHIVDAQRGVLVPQISINNIATGTPVTAPATGLLVWNTNAAITGGSGVGFYYWNGTQWSTLGGGANTLDQAYDEGGLGAGRTITADAGAVTINGTGGLSINASTMTLSSAIESYNTNGTINSDVKIGYVGTSGANVVLQGIRSIANITSATNQYDGGYGVVGVAQHPSNGTVNLNGNIGSANKAVGVYGGIGTRSSYTGSAQDMIAGVLGITGLHNSAGGSVTGSRMYAGLFAGNGRTLGLWGENSTYIELLPRWQSRDYDAAVVGFYNSAANGGNNGASTGSADSYFSIETNVTDNTSKHLILQNRSTGNVGIATNAPTVKFQVGDNGDGTIARANAWNTFSDRRWKTNFEVIPNTLAKLDQINGYFYNWKKGNDKSRQVGVVAQEIEMVLPQCVHTDENGYKSVDYSKLTAFLIQVNKEQQAEINNLKAAVKAIKIQ